ncbi:PP2C family protein-serine/threonine phosphatase [Streptomyces liangshanensis]|uniref:SpoIIE family protein phosphatase n=1 Tax=Streptomyces liangshanensis TaxID=2717324 RepID=A0A6G9H8B2_9ACTN|nr:SpoIIE family protein phosphatase [Streptomyces liangshanensis]QIQ06451.1 SpoIIE family protein phosphatase [Streptomyces liangshanensis]
MPSPLFADRPAPQPPERGSVDALITQTRRLRGDVDAVRRDASAEADDDDILRRWQRALCDLAVHQLDDLGAHLDQLRAGRPDLTDDPHGTVPAQGRSAGPPAPRPAPLTGRVGSAEWNLLTDEVTWSDELYEIFGRPQEAGPLSLDELPSLLFPEDQALLTAMVTACLIDGRPIDGEFRVLTAQGRVRTLHMMGEPVLDTGGCTASMWAVLRDVSTLRRSERVLRDTRDSVHRRQHLAQTEQRLVAELQQAVLPTRGGALELSRSGAAALDVAARHLGGASAPTARGDWYDALDLPGGDTLMTVGDLTGQGVAAASNLAMLLGALRGMAVAGIEPGALLGHLNQLLETSRQPALGSALCARYRPDTATLVWAQAANPAPLLFRDGTGRALTPPDGVLLGATTGAAYEQADLRLLPGDVLVLHTDGEGRAGTEARQNHLLALAPLLTRARTARECAETIVARLGGAGDTDDACVMVARSRGPEDRVDS